MGKGGHGGNSGTPAPLKARLPRDRQGAQLELGKLLRYYARSAGLWIRVDGFVKATDITTVRPFWVLTEQGVVNLAVNDLHFEVQEDDEGAFFVRATRSHHMEGIDATSDSGEWLGPLAGFVR